MAECALKNKEWIVSGDFHSECSGCTFICDICNRIVCRYHICQVSVCSMKCYGNSRVCICHSIDIRAVCDECIAHNAQHTIGELSNPVQDYITPKTLSDILSCYSGILTKPCKK